MSIRIAIIGCGGRVSHMIWQLQEIDSEVELAAVADPDEARVRKWLELRKVKFDNTKFFADADSLLENADQYDGVMIGTRCNLHTEMACKVAATGLPLFLEKPVAITPTQVEALSTAYKGREAQVVVSFPLRVTPLYKAVEEVVRSGRLGKINQVQAVNNVSYGGVYFGGWYRNYDQTGGLWLQKATHDFDYLNHLTDARPLMVAATITQGVYGGDKPHDLLCSQCDLDGTCDESQSAHIHRGDGGGMATTHLDGKDHYCCYSREIKNQDAGSALLMYDNGVHVNYTQNFVTRRSSYRRGARIIGQQATVEFDWPSNKMTVMDHWQDRVDEVVVKASTGHAGGDWVLADSFLRLIRGEGESCGDLRAGLLSVAMCLAARKSAYDRTFEPIRMPGETDDPAALVHPASEVPVA